VSDAVDPELGEGLIDDEVRAEFPELRLRTLEVARGSGRTPRAVRDRLRRLSDRFRGPQALALRRQPIPSAYRVFFRHIGLDPDTTRTPVEEAAMQRLIRGAFEATNLLDDALLIALVETGVPLWALDADAVAQPLGIGIDDGRLVVVDEHGVVAPLFGAVEQRVGVTWETARMLLYAVQPPGVPEIFVEEAMWSCLGVLQGEG
jgi:DNA/RNA-binding domain of Phe-tRNA-synthetase-like protein